MERVEIKNQAKEILNGRRGHAALVLLVTGLAYIFLYFLLLQIPIIGPIIGVILGIAYTIVLVKFIVELSNSREKIDCESLVPTFTMIWKYAVSNILVGIIGALFMIPISCFIALSAFNGLTLVVIFCIIALIIIAIIISLPIVFMQYIIVEKPESSIGEIISDGFKMALSNFSRMVVMYLSLIPWYLLVLITFGIASLYVMPYINTIFYLMYKDIKKETVGFYNKELI